MSERVDIFTSGGVQTERRTDEDTGVVTRRVRYRNTGFGPTWGEWVADTRPAEPEREPVQPPEDGPEVKLPAPFDRYLVQYPYQWDTPKVRLEDTREGTSTLYDPTWALVLGQALVESQGLVVLNAKQAARLVGVLNWMAGSGAALEPAMDYMEILSLIKALKGVR